MAGLLFARLAMLRTNNQDNRPALISEAASNYERSEYLIKHFPRVPGWPCSGTTNKQNRPAILSEAANTYERSESLIKRHLQQVTSGLAHIHE